MTKITTLIPAYKPDYLGEMFLGLKRQSVKDFRVILSDDSEGGAITNMIRDGRFGALQQELNLTVVPGPRNARLNHQHLIDLYQAGAERSPFVHFMLDDDVVFPDFYKTHLEAHAGGKYAVSVSARWLSQATAGPRGHCRCPSSSPRAPCAPCRSMPSSSSPALSPLARTGWAS
jgi:hypothetical protein